MKSYFSIQARLSMVLAKNAARRLGAKEIGVEHFAIGILEQPSCIASLILRTMQFHILKFKEEIESRCVQGPFNNQAGDMPFTQQAKTVLEQSAELAKATNRVHIGTDSLLQALLNLRPEPLALCIPDLLEKKEEYVTTMNNITTQSPWLSEFPPPLEVNYRPEVMLFPDLIKMQPIGSPSSPVSLRYMSRLAEMFIRLEGYLAPVYRAQAHDPQQVGSDPNWPLYSKVFQFREHVQNVSFVEAFKIYVELKRSLQQVEIHPRSQTFIERTAKGQSVVVRVVAFERGYREVMQYKADTTIDDIVRYIKNKYRDKIKDYLSSIHGGPVADEDVEILVFSDKTTGAPQNQPEAPERIVADLGAGDGHGLSWFPQKAESDIHRYTEPYT